MSRRTVTRRKFLVRGAGALLAAPAIASGWGYGGEGAPPSSKVRIGHIGVGGRGSGLLQESLGASDVEVPAVCEVDRERLQSAKKMTGGKADGVKDYREILDRKDVDAVRIATPDHWHAVITIEACASGKDVYVEKPLCTCLSEGRKMVSAARAHGRMVQVGINHRSEPDIREIAEIVRSGRIGKVREVKCWMWENPVKEPTPPPPAPPEGLDWDRWLGPAPKVPYHPDRVHFNFRWCKDYAGGYMTDWGVHMLNVVTLAMDVDHMGPETIEARGTFAPKNIWDFPLTMEARFEFKEPDFTLWWIQPAKAGECLPGEKYGMNFHGEAGTLRTKFGGYQFFAGGKEAPLPAGGKAVDVPKSPGHFRNWLDSIRSRKLPIADVEVGHRTTSLCQLGNAALFSGRKLKWDWRKETVEGGTKDAPFLEREWRAPYRPRST